MIKVQDILLMIVMRLMRLPITRTRLQVPMVLLVMELTKVVKLPLPLRGQEKMEMI